MVIMFLWGVNAGVAMTSHRTVRASTAPEMMGQVAGLMMTGFMGGLPIGALTPTLSVVVSPAWTMTIVGGATVVIASALSWRPAIVH